MSRSRAQPPRYRVESERGILALFADRADAVWWARVRSIGAGRVRVLHVEPRVTTVVAAFRTGADAPLHNPDEQPSAR